MSISSSMTVTSTNKKEAAKETTMKFEYYKVVVNSSNTENGSVMEMLLTNIRFSVAERGTKSKLCIP